MNQLKFIKAEAEFQIAEIELGRAEAAFAAAPPEELPIKSVGPSEESNEEAETTEDELQ
jgi:hypothetical protein